MLNYKMLSMLPGPEVIGEPFWFLMEWKDNRLTGNIFSQTGLCFFLRSQDAETLKKQLPAPHEWCVRGVNKKFFNFLLKQYTHYFNNVVPLLLVPPFLCGKKVLTLKITENELKYYANHGKFIDKNFQKSIDCAYNIVNNPPSDMYNKKLSIDPFLDLLNSNCLKYPRPYPELHDCIEKYRNILFKDAKHIKDEAKEFMNKISSKDQCYTRTFELPEKCSYDITWFIPDLKKIIKKYNLQATTLSLDTLVSIVDQSNIIPSYLNKALGNNEPILIIKYPLSLPNLCIVDGNHRVIAKHKASQTTIQGYIVEPQHHLEAMTFNVHRTLFKIHYNLYEIVKYMSCEISSENMKLLPLD